MFTIQFLAPIITSLCINNFLSKQGELCNARQQTDVVVNYKRENIESSCYLDGIFYPNCKDLNNPDVLYYHNLLYKK